MGAFKNTFQLNGSHTFYWLFAWFFFCMVCKRKGFYSDSPFYLPVLWISWNCQYMYLYLQPCTEALLMHIICHVFLSKSPIASHNTTELSCWCVTSTTYLAIKFSSASSVYYTTVVYPITNIDLLFMTICDVFLLFLIRTFASVCLFIFSATRGEGNLAWRKNVMHLQYYIKDFFSSVGRYMCIFLVGSHIFYPHFCPTKNISVFVFLIIDSSMSRRTWMKYGFCIFKREKFRKNYLLSMCMCIKGMSDIYFLREWYSAIIK